MQHIHLNDDSYILHTSKGITTLNRRSFNFNKIKTLIKKGAEEADILPLLSIPEMPNGIFELYLHVDSNTMLIKHMLHGGMTTNWSNLNNVSTIINHQEAPLQYQGVYVSVEDIMEDWPEYIL